MATMYEGPEDFLQSGFMKFGNHALTLTMPRGEGKATSDMHPREADLLPQCGKLQYRYAFSQPHMGIFYWLARGHVPSRSHKVLNKKDRQCIK